MKTFLDFQLGLERILSCSSSFPRTINGQERFVVPDICPQMTEKWKKCAKIEVFESFFETKTIMFFFILFVVKWPGKVLYSLKIGLMDKDG